MSEPGDEQAQIVPARSRRLLILAICSMSVLVVGLDTTVINIALPAIHRSFHSALSGLQWTVDAYTLVGASLLMLSASTADRVGRRRIFRIGLICFLLGSLMSALAPSLELLIAARVLQAIGGSMLTPVALSIVRNVFVDPRERARAIGVWSGVFGISMALGPVVGGALVDSLSWRAVFLVNLPICALILLLTFRFVPESRAWRPRRIDAVGQILVIVALATITYAIIEAPSAGWAGAQTLGLAAIAALSLIVLVPYERRRHQPLIEMRFFRSAPFSAASAIAMTLFLALGGFLFLNTLYLQEVRGLSPFIAGLYTLPMAVVMMVAAPVAGRVVSNRGTHLPIIGGSLALIASGVMLAQLTPHTSLDYLVGAYVLFGLGAGALNPAISDTAVSGMPAAQAGVAAAIASTSRQVGSTLGVAVLGALAAPGATGLVGPSFAENTHVSWWIVAGVGVVIFVLGMLTNTARAARSAQSAAMEIHERDLRAATRGEHLPSPEPEPAAQRGAHNGSRSPSRGIRTQTHPGAPSHDRRGSDRASPSHRAGV